MGGGGVDRENEAHCNPLGSPRTPLVKPNRESTELTFDASQVTRFKTWQQQSQHTTPALWRKGTISVTHGHSLYAFIPFVFLFMVFGIFGRWALLISYSYGALILCFQELCCLDFMILVLFTTFGIPHFGIMLPRFHVPCFNYGIWILELCCLDSMFLLIFTVCAFWIMELCCLDFMILVLFTT